MAVSTTQTRDDLIALYESWGLSDPMNICTEDAAERICEHYGFNGIDLRSTPRGQALLTQTTEWWRDQLLQFAVYVAGDEYARTTGTQHFTCFLENGNGGLWVEVCTAYNADFMQRGLDLELANNTTTEKGE